MHSVRRRRLALLPAIAVAAMLLTSCATPRTPVKVPAYVAPAGVATARLLSRGTVGAGDAYGVIVFDDAANCAGPRIAGAGNSTRPPKATEIEAGRIATLDFLAVRPDKTSCRVRWSFTPTAGKTYLVAGALTATGCNARLLDATDPDRMRAEYGAAAQCRRQRVQRARRATVLVDDRRRRAKRRGRAASRRHRR